MMIGIQILIMKYNKYFIYLKIIIFLLFKQNETNEKSQRFGSTSVPGTGRIDHVDFKTIQEKIKTADSTVKQFYQDKNPNRGYGGKFGKDQVMDKVNFKLFILIKLNIISLQSAADFSYKADVKKHSSQTGKRMICFFCSALYET